MNKKTITKIMIPVTLAIWGIYDVYTIHHSGVHTSISRVIRDWNQDYPQFIYAFVYILGHLLWPQPPKDSEIDRLKKNIFKLKSKIKYLEKRK